MQQPDKLTAPSSYPAGGKADISAYLPAGSHIEAVVCYRKPHDTHYNLLIQNQQPLVLNSLQQVPLTGGYVVMPFVVTPHTPIVFITPDIQEHLALPAPQLAHTLYTHTDEAAQRLSYRGTFAAAHSRLLQGELQKMVLSRRLHINLQAQTETAALQQPQLHQLCTRGFDLFLKACHYRPNSFVSFWWTRQTGAWLVATPEPLLEKRNHGFGTIALAGTLPWKNGCEPQWDHKNREEQAIVARFIAQQLQGVATDVKQSETYSLRAGNIQHLCTDFNFGLPSDKAIRQLLCHLHPTPAVCGLPRNEALKAIENDETEPRRYYAGFSGPLLLQGDTSLYVSLRCMEFDLEQATLYAGGGLMPESNEQDEWDETGRKLQTMLQLF